MFRDALENAKKSLALKAIEIGRKLILLGPSRSLKKRPRKILVDNSILGHSIYIETYKVTTGAAEWGGKGVESSQLSGIPVYAADNKSELYAEIRYLTTIAELIKLDRLEAYTSMELELEKWRHPRGRFNGYSLLDVSLFGNIHLASIDGFAFRPTESLEEQKDRVQLCTDPLFQSLIKFFPPKSNLDVWHICTAERNGIDCFLTMDFKFVKQFLQASKRIGFPTLNTRPMKPSEFARIIGADPMHPVALQFLSKGARYELTQSSPSQKRRKQNRP